MQSIGIACLGFGRSQGRAKTVSDKIQMEALLAPANEKKKLNPAMPSDLSKALPGTSAIALIRDIYIYLLADFGQLP